MTKEKTTGQRPEDQHSTEGWNGFMRTSDKKVKEGPIMFKNPEKR